MTNELYHHGVKGQKWGVRRYQRKDGSLTKAGLKRQKVLDDARDNAERHAKYARDDAKRLRNEYESSKKKPITDDDINKHLRMLYGNDVKNKAYMQEEAEAYGFKNIKDYAKEDLEYTRKQNKRYIEVADKYAAKCDELVNKYSNMKVSEISKNDLKEAKRIAKDYYSLGSSENEYKAINVSDRKS